MDDLTKQEAAITDELWKEIDRIERALMSVRNALENTGLGASVATAAEVVAEQALALAKTAARGQGHADAVQRM